MMKDTNNSKAIIVENVSKFYTVWSNPSARLRANLLAPFTRAPWVPRSVGAAIREKAQRACRRYDALRNVSMSVDRGETVGIVGANGAGKSTLLKIIVGTIQPSEGTVTTNGNINALLELATGFNPDFSGRENVLLNGALLGLSEREVRSRFDEIADFAAIGDFIDQPIKTYSSGMVMRLAFACSTVLNPDILVVDEALGVGDTPFQAKCLARMRSLVDQGTTILFTSHSTAAVRSFCTKALYLDKGNVVMWGDAKDVCSAYEKACWKQMGMLDEEAAPEETAADAPDAADGEQSPGAARSTGLADLVEGARVEFQENAAASTTGNGAVAVRNFYLADEFGRPCKIVEHGQVVYPTWEVEGRVELDTEVECCFSVKNPYGQAVSTYIPAGDLHRLKTSPGCVHYIRTHFQIALGCGEYYIAISIMGGKNGAMMFNGVIDHTAGDIISYIEHAFFFSVNPMTRRGSESGVYLYYEPEWSDEP